MAITAVTLAEVNTLTQSPLVLGVVNAVADIDTLINFLPFTPAAQGEIKFKIRTSRHGATNTGLYGAVNKTLAEHKRVTHHIGRAMGDVPIDPLFDVTREGVTDEEVAALIDALAEKMTDNLYNGNGDLETDGQPYGLGAIVAEYLGLGFTNQKVNHVDLGAHASTGFTITPSNLRILVDRIKPQGGMKFIVGNQDAVRKYHDSLVAISQQPQWIEYGLRNPITNEVGYHRILSFNGIPFFTSDKIGTETTDSQTGRTRLYAGVLGGRGVSGLLPLNPNLPEGQQLNGMVRYRGQQFDPDTATEIIRCEAYYGFTCQDPGALAMATNVNVA